MSHVNQEGDGASKGTRTVKICPKLIEIEGLSCRQMKMVDGAVVVVFQGWKLM